MIVNVSLEQCFCFVHLLTREGYSNRFVCVCVCVCVCVSVCLLVRNLGECFVSLLVEPIAGKNMSLSDKQLWRFLKNVSVAEKS